MKKYILCLLIGFFTISFAWAQRSEREMPKPEEIANRQTKMMTDSLQLNDKQIEKVSKINLEYAEKMRKIWENEALAQGEKMQEIQVLNTNKDYEIKKCLTKDQAKRYQQIQEAMRKRRQERKPMKDKE